MRRESVITWAIASSITLGLFLTIAVVWGVGAKEVLDRFLHTHWYFILGYLCTSVLLAMGVTYKWRVVLDAYGVRLPFYTLFIYRLIGFAVGYVTPMAHVGGEPVRALLVHRQGIPAKVSFSAVIVDKLLELIFNIGVFFLGALIIVNSTTFPLVARATIFALSVVLVVAASIFTYNIFKRKKVFVPLLRRLGFTRLKQWPQLRESANEFELLIEHFYANKKRHFQQSILINAILWCLMFIEYKLALLILGYDASLFGIFLFVTGVGIAYSIPIPAALGVLEIGQVSAGALLGLKASIGVALAFLVRMRDLSWTFIGLFLLGLYHHNIFNLYEKSQQEARKYNLEKLHLEMRSLLEDLEVR